MRLGMELPWDARRSAVILDIRYGACSWRLWLLVWSVSSLDVLDE